MESIYKVLKVASRALSVIVLVLVAVGLGLKGTFHGATFVGTVWTLFGVLIVVTVIEFVLNIRIAIRRRNKTLGSREA
jgi:uncharacterized Tic20 family protein